MLTSAARAQITSLSAPFDLSNSSGALVLRVDQGASAQRSDSPLPSAGLITVPVAGWNFASSPAASADEVVSWLNANAAFAARAIATRSGSRVTIRSRGLGALPGIQLVASSVATAVFGGDLTLKMPGGVTASNQLTSTSDPMVTRFGDHIEYQLDPVTDLEPGTYVVNLEVAQLGRVSATSYVTPSTTRLRFQVKQVSEEPLVATGCDSCHQSTTGPDSTGLDGSHAKNLDAAATDQCIACHDYQAQAASDVTGVGAWTGARPLSRRVHALHMGSSLTHPLRTVDAAGGDPVPGRQWNLTFPQSVLNCETCHPSSTSGAWRAAGRLACSGCHDGDAVTAHLAASTFDPTPVNPWSGDEAESCQTCH